MMAMRYLLLVAGTLQYVYVYVFIISSYVIISLISILAPVRNFIVCPFIRSAWYSTLPAAPNIHPSIETHLIEWRQRRHAD
jgi:hypothetical protein